MEAGHGLEGIMNDAKAGRFLLTYATASETTNEVTVTLA